MKILFTLSLAILLSACGGPRYVDFFPCHDDGRPKPQVVLLPVQVHENCEEGYADVLQGDIRYCLMDHGELYVFDDADVNKVVEKRTDVDFYGQDLAWTKCFRNVDFIASVESIEHRPYNYRCGCNMPYVVLKLRLRVIDARGDCPRVILNELFESCQQVILPRGGEVSLPMQKGSHHLLCDKLVDRMERVIRSTQ